MQGQSPRDGVMSSHNKRVQYHRLEPSDQIELLTVGMEEGVEVQFSGSGRAEEAGKPPMVSLDSSKDFGDGGEEGFINVPVSIITV